MTENKRPNILFAIADDASHFHAYGHKFVHTPGFDWVAEHGALFENAFTTNPKCAPSRASILTGRHTWQLEEACNHLVCTFPEKYVCYPDILEENGYHVGHTGKGWAPGFWEETRKCNPAGPLFEGAVLERPEYTNVSTNDYAANFDDFLSMKPEEAPFCFWFGAHEPHRHYVPGEGIRNGKSLDEIDGIPSYWPDDDIVKNDLLDYAFEIEWFDAHLERMLQSLRDKNLLENTIVVVTSDNGCPFPRVKGQMYEQDFHLPLAVCWPNRVPAGRRVKDLISFVDFAPTLLEAAGIPVHSQMSGRSFLSVLASEQSGWVSEDRRVVYMGRECHDCGREGDVGYPVRCIRNETYLYVRNFAPERWPAGNPETQFPNCDGSPTKDLILELQAQGISGYFDLAFGKRPAEELYDVAQDPECLKNLAEIPTFDSLKQSLWIQLKTFLEETDDPRILGKGEIFDQYVVEKFALLDSSWKAYVEGWWKKPSYLDWEEYVNRR